MVAARAAAIAHRRGNRQQGAQRRRREWGGAGSGRAVNERDRPNAHSAAGGRLDLKQEHGAGFSGAGAAGAACMESLKHVDQLQRRA
jgi:hypothetical protein